MYGIPQRTYILREESTSHTITLEALFASLLTDSNEWREVHNFDVPGEYIHTSLSDDKVLHMKFEVEFVEIMCKVNPEY